MLGKHPEVISAPCPECNGKGLTEPTFTLCSGVTVGFECKTCHGEKKIWSVIMVEDKEDDTE
jgi:DnaJ-class molecular chaperone